VKKNDTGGTTLMQPELPSPSEDARISPLQLAEGNSTIAHELESGARVERLVIFASTGW